MKSNKSLTKRLRVTKTGKVLARKAGGNHYNAKESRSTQLNRKRGTQIVLSKKNQARFLPGKSGR
jgi:ribosomal protein L35